MLCVHSSNEDSLIYAEAMRSQCKAASISLRYYPKQLWLGGPQFTIPQIRAASDQLPDGFPALPFQTTRRRDSNRAKLGPEQGSKQPIPPSLN